MKKLYQAALLAALGLVGVAGAQAAPYNGDLLLGFSSGAGNDLVYDLGARSSLVDGQTWNLTSLLAGYDLNTINWGVIGDKNVSGVRLVWSTTGGAPANTITGNTAWGTLDNITASIYFDFSTAGAGNYITPDSTTQNSWNQQTLVGSLTTQYHNAYENPNVTGLSSASLFEVINNGSTPTQIGTFTLDNSGGMTFNVTAVPEPGTAGLIGGGALLMLALRNKFRRTQS